MSSEIIDLFKEFSRENLVKWGKEALGFFKAPRKFLQVIYDRSATDLIPQYIFYFLVYCSSYLFLSIGLSLNELLKPALLSISTIIPTIIIFSFSTYIATGKWYAKKIIFCLVSINLFLAPVILISYALFLNNEDYFYRLLLNLILSIISLFMVFGFGFCIEKKGLKALKIVLVNYLIINMLWLAIERINFDPNGGITRIQDGDPIFDEYSSFTKPLKVKDKIPMSRSFIEYNGKVFSTFVTQDIISDTVATGGTLSNNIYISEIENSIKILDKKSEGLKFERNKVILSMWRDYFSAINSQITFSVKDTDELNSLKPTLISVQPSGIRLYSMPLQLDSIISLQIQLKRYHNSLLKSAQRSSLPNEASDIAIFFLGKVLDSLMFDLFNEGKPATYKEKFNEMEQ